jgi:hypothetical protein
VFEISLTVLSMTKMSLQAPPCRKQADRCGTTDGLVCAVSLRVVT